MIHLTVLNSGVSGMSLIPSSSAPVLLRLVDDRRGTDPPWYHVLETRLQLTLVRGTDRLSLPDPGILLAEAWCLQSHRRATHFQCRQALDEYVLGQQGHSSEIVQIS